MEIFQKASVVRLCSHHDKYLIAENDQETVGQDRDGSSRNSRWAVEFVDSSPIHIRLKSCFGKYLTASNMPLLIGMRGKKVLQTLPRRLDSSVEWEPIREGVQVRFMTRYGRYLRANAKLPPWRGHITHDIPHRSVTQDWILWTVDVMVHKPRALLPPPPLETTTSEQCSDNEEDNNSNSDDPGSPSEISLRGPGLQSGDSTKGSPSAFEGRKIRYEVVDENGDVDKKIGERTFTFKGSGVEELKKILKVETGVNEDIWICSRNPLNGKLSPLRLHLPPNNAAVHVIVVPQSSKVANELENR
ncbi:hypothetical protein E1A91_D07G251800v1 [Gossypium mustelinum]|uniref:Uncharacterized protein n=1 Tax=Gossypium mustelinum TaxID=34275 RepID=A0A5D2UE41_GOSMU|nr:hypothetical protein E1A91_D07G251800v1 [Gossypium mustelinum]